MKTTVDTTSTTYAGNREAMLFRTCRDLGIRTVAVFADADASAPFVSEAEAASATERARVLSRIPTAYRNVPSQPRTRSYEPDLTVSYSSGFVQHDLDDVTIVTASPARVVLDVGGVTETYTVAVGDGWVDVDGPHGSVDLTPVPDFVDPADVVAQVSLLAPLPASVISVVVVDGQQVAKGDVVVVLEAMKMQHTIMAPTDGTVTGLSVTAGAQVESGAVLAVIESATVEGEAP